jgi:hypothetical protein
MPFEELPFEERPIERTLRTLRERPETLDMACRCRFGYEASYNPATGQTHDPWVAELTDEERAAYRAEMLASYEAKVAEAALFDDETLAERQRAEDVESLRRTIAQNTLLYDLYRTAGPTPTGGTPDA